MKRRNLRLACSLALALALPSSGFSKGYSSGGGRSYSSHSSSSSHSFSSGSSHSFSSGSSRSSSSGFGSSRSSSSKSFSSGGGKSYSSGASSSGNRTGYSSGKSYSSGSGTTFSSKPSKSFDSSASKSSSGSSGFGFDQSAARARKEQASKSDYGRYQDSQRPPPIPRASGGSYSGGSRTYRTVYVPDYTVIHTRPSRINIYFGSYAYRPWVYYHDPYSSLFWWWLLDRSIDEQAYWAYHHRYDMDPARYDALLASNQQLQGRVAQLEAQQVARDPSYTPTSLDATNRDLMYSDQYVNQAYQNRSTPVGRMGFWVFGVPMCIGASVFFVWFVFFKRW